MNKKDTKQVQLTIPIEQNGTEYTFEVSLKIFNENSLWYAYSPAFDITAYGKDFNNAISEFYLSFQIYAEYCISKGTLVQDLIEHGWKLSNEYINN